MPESPRPQPNDPSMTPGLGRGTDAAIPSPSLWRLAALVLAIVALSSVAPLVRLGEGMPVLTASDVGDAALYLIAWLPFIALLLGYEIGAMDSERDPVSPWVVHIALLLVIPAAHALTFLVLDAVAYEKPMQLGSLVASVRFQQLTLLGTLQYLVVLAVLLAVLVRRAAHRSRLRAVELELHRARAESQLVRTRGTALRGQLQPHFLFNTLNTISAITGADPDAAREMLARLNELLRAALGGEDCQTIPLRRELELLDAYVEIQRARFGERLRVDVKPNADVVDVPVPTLILQPLVESAIQHAISHRESGGVVAVTAHREGDRLILQVTDDGPGCGAYRGVLSESEPLMSAARGTGHQHAEARMRELYGDACAFTFEPAPGGGCIVRMELPLMARDLASGSRAPST